MSSVPHQTVSIVGGGLAGLALGVALRRADVPVALFEAGDYPRHRVCGEFMAGLDDATVQRLGIEQALADAGAERRVTWYLRNEAVGGQTLPQPARTISRFVLDARLVARFTALGGHLRRGVRQALPPESAGWVDAAGRRRNTRSPWMGLKAHFGGIDASAGLELHLGDGAYVGLATVEDGWVNVCGLFRRRPGLTMDRASALPAYLRASGLDGLAARLAAGEMRLESASAVAALQFDRKVGLGDGIRLGDAVAMIPPFTGNGMAMALIGAACAVDPLVAWARRERSWPETVGSVQSALQAEFRTRLAGASLLHPFLVNPSLQRGLGAAARTGLLPLTRLYHLLH